MSIKSWQVTCDSCGQMIEKLKPRAKKKMGGIHDVGFDCDQCDVWHHSHYTNTEIRKQQAKLQRLQSKQYQSEIVIAEIKALKRLIKSGIEELENYETN